MNAVHILISTRVLKAASEYMSFAKHAIAFSYNLSIIDCNIVRQELKKRRAPTSFYCLRYELKLTEYALPINTCRSKQLDK